MITFQLGRLCRSITQAALILGFSGLVHAAYPDKPIKLIVPYPPGGATDVIGRILAKNLGDSLGQQVLVENRGGAGGNIGAEAVAKATPDGYTLLMGAVTSHSTMATLEKGKLRYDILKDFTPVMIVGSVPLVIVVNPNVPVRTLKGLVEYAKANPDKMNYASSGPGAPQRMGAEILQREAGLKITHVPYKGAGPAVQDLLGGQVDLFFTTPASVVSHIKAEKLKGLAVTSNTRLSSLPNVPTTRESDLKDFTLDSWFALYAPAGTPNEVVQQLNTEISKILASSEVKKKAEDAGTLVDHMGPAQLGEYTRKELAYWGRVINDAKISAD